jgi:molybdopterin converting factor small subunit
VARLLLFGPARQLAGAARAELAASTLAELRAAACERWGPRFAEVLSASALWINGEPVSGDPALAPGDEVAVIPPVSGGT